MTEYRPQIPSSDRDLDVFTFEDAVSHVLDVYESSEDERLGRVLRLGKRAVLRAYRDLPNRDRWNYFSRRAKFVTSASQTDGTVDYDHTGGGDERELTLSGATWPDWARFGRVVLGGVHYEIEDRKSATVLTLRSGSNPGADLSSQSYTLYRSSYAMPIDFRRLDRLFDTARERELGMLPAGDHLSQSLHFEYGIPDNFTILSAPEYFGSLALVFDRAPTSAATYDLLYEASPRPLRTERESQGTVTTSGASVTGTNTAFSSRHVGCILRIGDSELPTGIDGSNPALEQRVVMSVESATALTLDQAVESDRTGAKYTLSDPLDVEPTAMLTALLRMAEAEFARLTRQKDRNDLDAAAEIALLDAMAADSRYSPSGVASVGYYPPHLRPWSTEEVVNPNE